MTARRYSGALVDNNGGLTAPQIVTGSCPVGTIVPYMGLTAPSGYLACQGQTINSANYSELFALIGYTYGGSGSSFVVPDLEQYFTRGMDNMGTGSAGRDPDSRSLGSVQSQNIDSHRHNVGVVITYNKHTNHTYHSFDVTSSGAHDHTIYANLNITYEDPEYIQMCNISGNSIGSSYETHTHSWSGYTNYDGSHGHNDSLFSGSNGTSGDYGTKPRNIALKFCIKY